MKEIRIGTRGSQLALFQANTVKALIKKEFPELKVSIEVIKTKGDKILDVALSKIGDKGLFTKEIEAALANKDIDLAVHSLKDMPTTLPQGLILAAFLERGEFRDALVSRSGKKLKDLDENDIIATSSLRRQAGLYKLNPNFTIKDIRGNVNTRLKRMDEGYCDAMIMAAAGLQRLQLDNYISEIIEPSMIIPAASQGVICIEARANDYPVLEILQDINHKDTELAIRAERAFLRKLEGGCQVPMGCYSKITDSQLTLKGFVASLKGQDYLESKVDGDIKNPESIGMELADSLLAMGAKDILKKVRG